MKAAPVLARWGERAAALLWPRRCPFCGALLGHDAVLAAVCADCAAEEQRLLHTPPRLPATEHSFSALTAAFGGYYYSGDIRHAILLCKEYENPWYARELADLLAVRVFGAAPARAPGLRPVYHSITGLPLYTSLVPVPPRLGGAEHDSLPYLLAKRLGLVLGIPLRQALAVTRQTQEQKSLTQAERFRNVRGAYAVKQGADLTGERVLLVDDIITTGATVSACAQALLEAGAAEVTALCLAANEELPKEKRGDDKTNRRTRNP